MRQRAQRGLLLLPVALMLAIAGAAAYAVPREGSMSAAAVDARYEYEAARYLAEAGVKLAVWQNGKRGCASPVTFAPFEMAGGSISAEGVVDDVSGGSELALTIVASFRGASYRIERKDDSAMPFYDISRKTDVQINGSDGNDTFIRQGLTSDQNGLTYLEVSDALNNNAHALLQFPLGAISRDAKLIQAELQLFLESHSTVQSQPTLSVHRVTRSWPDNTIWTSPWTTPGGDYVSLPEATIDLNKGFAAYSLPITVLVDSWINKARTNNGVLLRTSGMTNARYASSSSSVASGAHRPLLLVSYYPACT